jgi:hypothetical protein
VAASVRSEGAQRERAWARGGTSMSLAMKTLSTSEKASPPAPATASATAGSPPAASPADTPTDAASSGTCRFRPGLSDRPASGRPCGAGAARHGRGGGAGGGGGGGDRGDGGDQEHEGERAAGRADEPRERVAQERDLRRASGGASRTKRVTNEVGH